MITNLDINSNTRSDHTDGGTPPLISIGMPVYNAQRYLPEALDSILGQTYGNLEVIISDNASDDATDEICRSYAARDRRIRYYRFPENRGAAVNYNTVFRLAVGRYFKWAASDDIIAPDVLKRCVDHLEIDSAAVLCYPRTTIIGPGGEIVRNYDDGLDLSLARPRDRFRRLLHTIGECNAVFGVIRRDVLAQTRLIGNYIGSDICLLLELSLYGQFHEIPERLFYRRDHPAASSSDKSIPGQLRFFDPRLKSRAVFPYWRRVKENFISVSSASLNISEKLWLYSDLARYIWRSRGFPKEVSYAIKSTIGLTGPAIARNQR